MSSKSLFKFQSIVAIVLVTGLNAGAATPDAPQANALGSLNLSSLLGQNNDLCSSQNSRVDSKQQQANESANSMLQSLDQSEQQSLAASQKAGTDGIQQGNLVQECQADLQKSAAQLIVDLNAAQSKSAEKVQQIQNQIIAQDEKVNAAAAALRSAGTAIQAAQNDQEQQCRTDAQNAGSEKQKAIDAAYIASKAAKINYSTDALAGADNRRKERRLIDIQNEYMTAYKNCIGGTGGSGPATTAKIKNSQLALGDAQDAYNRQMATIKKETAALKQQVAQAIKDGVDSATAAKLKEQVDQTSLVAKCNGQMALLGNDANNALQQSALADRQQARRVNQVTQQAAQAGWSLRQATYSADVCNASQTASQGQATAIWAACFHPPTFAKAADTPSADAATTDDAAAAAPAENKGDCPYTLSVKPPSAADNPDAGKATAAKGKEKSAEAATPKH
jgi:hypothetical protein